MMNNLENLPDAQIEPNGPISQKFLELGISSYIEACNYLHNLPYGYNSDYSDMMILFKEQKGSCTTKHAIAAGLAQELGVLVKKHIAVYRFTKEIVIGADTINKKYNIPYTPLTHCFLITENHQIDLTEGNKNGKIKSPLTQIIDILPVNPFFTQKEEYLWYRQVVQEKILPNSEMNGINLRTLLEARTEAIHLLKEKVK